MILGGLLPYPDLPRRRRIRSAARNLVTLKRWTGSEATGVDAAMLAVLHLLWLQRETRRAVRGHQAEGAVLLARASIETCILGLYCLYADDAVVRLQAANIKSMHGMLAEITKDGLVSQATVDGAMESFGKQGPHLKIWDMVQRVEKEPGRAGIVSLYRNFYMPTSNMFAHPSAATLLRHVGSDGQLTDRPDLPWSRRSAVRTADACLGLLATAVAEATGDPPEVFARYAEDHRSRMLTPFVFIVGQGFRQSVKWGRLLRAILGLRDLRAYLAGPGMRDSPEERGVRIRESFEKAFSTIQPSSSELDAALRIVLNNAVSEVATAWDKESRERTK
jgi:hypothetical protein